MTRAIVVGAGVVGASIAYRLAHGGAQVTVIEAGEPGGETTGRSFAWLNANHKPPEPYHRLNAEGIDAHRRLRDALGRGPWLHETGNLVYAPDVAAAQALAERVERLRALDYAAELIDGRRASELEPAVRWTAAAAVGWFPGEAWAHGPTLAAALIDAARELGAQVRAGTRVEAIDIGSDSVDVRVRPVDAAQMRSPRTAAGASPAEPPSSAPGEAEAIRADVVVIAAGRFSDRVAALAGVRVSLAPTSGLLAVTSAIAGGPERIAYLPGVHARPDGDGRYVLQDGDTDRQVGPETPEDAALPGCQLLLDRARRYVPALEGATIDSARVGIRSLPADGFPIVGWAPENRRVYLSVTHSGMTLGPLLGELVAAEVISGRQDGRLATFRPGRPHLTAV